MPSSDLRDPGCAQTRSPWLAQTWAPLDPSREGPPRLARCASPAGRPPGPLRALRASNSEYASRARPAWWSDLYIKKERGGGAARASNVAKFDQTAGGCRSRANLARRGEGPETGSGGRMSEAWAPDFFPLTRPSSTAPVGRAFDEGSPAKQGREQLERGTDTARGRAQSNNSTKDRTRPRSRETQQA